MRWTHSMRLGVLVGVPIVMTAALTGLVWPEEPASPKPAAKAAVSWAGAKTGHVREVQQALSAAGYDPGYCDQGGSKHARGQRRVVGSVDAMSVLLSHGVTPGRKQLRLRPEIDPRGR